MHRFFIPAQSLQGEEISLPTEMARQISRVLRMRVGESILLLDGLGNQYPADLVSIRPDEVRVRIQARQPATGEPGLKLHLFVCLTQREKFEWILQKCTEAGASSFTPLISHTSLLQDPAEAERKYERWKKIIQEATEQCRRGRVPELLQTCRFADAVHTVQEQRIPGLFLWEGEKQTSLRQVMQNMQARYQSLADLVVFIGAEGGFSVEEAALANTAGIQPVSLGRRILRMETAALAATVVILYEMGEMEI
jgi:16S rRNA (uracil1498-N3)-methyltransferase